MAYNSFEDLEVWKRACNLAVQTYGMMRTCRDYGFKDQMTRAAVSVASNIAEGAERLKSRIHPFFAYRQRFRRRTPDPGLYCAKN